MTTTPLPPVGDGQRRPGGQFAPGNRLAVGNPFARRVAQLRSAALQSVSTADMRAIIGKLVADAVAGNVQAAKEILERTLGRPCEPDLMERLERIEAALDLNKGIAK